MFGERWTALTGANETGKSTLIKLVSGVVSAGDGNVVCPQDSEAVPACFTESEILNSSEFFALLTQLEIGDDWIERWGTLSGGEKKRCCLVDALIRKPVVLILDESANHIDARTTRLLTAALSSFEGTGIVVLHNMAFLDALASSTVMLVPGQSAAGTLAPSRAFVFDCPPLNALARV